MEIFGIGTAEFLMVALFVLLIAGPRRSALWAREAGRYVRQFRIVWQKMMDEMTKELGEDGKQIRKAAEDIQRVTGDIRRTVSTPNLVGEALKIAETVENNRGKAIAPPSDTAPATPTTAPEQRYSAWQYPTEANDSSAATDPNSDN